MPTSQAQIDTLRADRYLDQLCEHLAHLPARARHAGPGPGHAPTQVLGIERTDRQAVISFDWGTWAIQADDTGLVLRVEASDDAALRHAEALVAHRLETIGSRERLTVEWHHRGVS